MRFSTCLKIVQLSGIFWNQRLIQYNSKWCGWGYTLGPKKMLRLTFKRFSDGVFSPSFVRHRSLRRLTFQDIGFYLLQYSTPFLSIVKPWSWALLLNIKARSHVGFRLKRGLPSKGQRTRSNHATVKRLKDAASYELFNEGLSSICGFAAARKSLFLLKKQKTKQGKTRQASGGGKKKPAVRSAKKPNVWR